MPVRDGMPPIHPGEFIAEDLEELGLSAADLDSLLSVKTGYRRRDIGKAAGRRP